MTRLERAVVAAKKILKEQRNIGSGISYLESEARRASAAKRREVDAIERPFLMKAKKLRSRHNEWAAARDLREAERMLGVARRRQNARDLARRIREMGDD